MQAQIVKLFAASAAAAPVPPPAGGLPQADRAGLPGLRPHHGGAQYSQQRCRPRKQHSQERGQLIEANSQKNTIIFSQDRFQRMLSLQSRLGDFELVKAGRELIKEVTEIFCILFILITSCFLSGRAEEDLAARVR